MFFLLFLSQQCRGEGNAVEVIYFFVFVRIFLYVILFADELAESRHQVVESADMIVHCTSRYMSRPAGDKWDTDTSFIALAFQATQFTVSAEECRISSAFFVRAVVAGENDQCILVQSFLFQLFQYFSDVVVQSRNHSCKLCVYMRDRVVSRSFAAFVALVRIEFLFIFI